MIICCCPRFTENITAQQKRLKRLHAVFWNSSGLQAEWPAGWTDRPSPGASAFPSCQDLLNDFLLQGWDVRHVIVFVSPCPAAWWDSSHWASLNPLQQMCDVACHLVGELLAGNNGGLRAHTGLWVWKTLPRRVWYFSKTRATFWCKCAPCWRVLGKRAGNDWQSFPFIVPRPRPIYICFLCSCIRDLGSYPAWQWQNQLC